MLNWEPLGVIAPVRCAMGHRLIIASCVVMKTTFYIWALAMKHVHRKPVTL